MTRILKIFILSLLVTSTSFADNDLTKHPIFEIGMKRIFNLMEKCVSEQEKTLEIKFDQKPKITHRPLSPTNNGRYNPKTNTIIFSSMSIIEMSTTTATLHHELAHFYCDLITEKYGLGSIEYDESSKEEKKISMIIVIEGLAKYVEKKMTEQITSLRPTINFPDLSNTKLEEITYGQIYNTGYELVRPIADRFGFERTVLHLLKNLPKKEDLKNLKIYQTKVIQELSQTN